MNKAIRQIIFIAMAAIPLPLTAQHGLSVSLGKRARDSTRITILGLGLTNYADSLRGVQLNAVSNLVARGKGVQAGGLSNLALTPFKGVQLSAVTNIAMGVRRGLQLGGVLNVSSGYMRGAQIATVNYTDTLNGSQLGLVNVAHSQPRGWQVGIVNYSRDTVAHRIGLVNVTPNTIIDFMAYGGSSSKGNVAARFRNRSTYSIIGAGSHFMGLDKKFSGALFYRIGQYLRTSPKWSFSGDIGYYHIETFQHHKADRPERLFSLQTHLNADYQISDKVGAYASVGWGDTRYYHHWRHYRNRPLVEAGLTFRYPKGQKKSPLFSSEGDTFISEDILSPPGDDRVTPVAFWSALGFVTAINAGVHLFDRVVTNQDFAQTTLKTWRRNFKNGFVWDNDIFATNLFMHPYHGNLYFNAARSQGLSFWKSVPFAMLGSLEWEFLGEIEPPALNDLIATTFGGICIGEMTNRVSRAILNDSKRGWPRFWRELGATLINPMGGLKRLATGDAWHVRDSHYLYHDHSKFPLDFSISAGDRYLADNGEMFRGEHNPYINLYMEYGDPVNAGGHNKPYDFFDAEVTFGLSSNQPIINQLHIMGRLWSTPMYANRLADAEFGFYQHFDYFDSKPVKHGSDLTPYRISEAAAFGPGIILQMPSVGMLTRLEQRIFANGILLGGTKSDYYNVIDRDYNMGSGFSLKSKTHLEMHNFGRFILHAQFYKIYTWKGYDPSQDLSLLDHEQMLHLNSQGDKGNASLLVLNPMLEVDIRENWSLVLSASSFFRDTHYKYHPDMSMDTFEFRAGLTIHLDNKKNR